MPESFNDMAAREERLCEIIGAYYAASEDGHEPDRAGWLSRHPTFAADLAEFFAEQDRLHRLAEPLRPVAEAASLDGAPGARRPNGRTIASTIARTLRGRPWLSTAPWMWRPKRGAAISAIMKSSTRSPAGAWAWSTAPVSAA